MTTKITSTGSRIAGVAGRGAPRATAASGKSTQATAAPRADGAAHDAVQLAARLQELAQLIASTPEVDVARVAELRQAVRRGVYRLDPQLIAERLIALEFRLNEVRRA